MNKILKWLDNFWYHYKWRVIVIGFFAIVFTVCVTQCATKTDPDVSVLYVGPQVVADEMYVEMENALEKRVDTDYNKDKKISVQITDIVYLSDEQLKEKQEAAAAEDDYLWYDTSSRTQSLNQAKNWILSGQMLICLLDPAVYEIFAAQELFMPLAEYLDEVPEYAYDEYSIPLSKIEFVGYFSAFAPIAEDTLLCVVKPTWTSSLSGNEAAERYEVHFELIRNILKFTVLED